MPDALPAGFAGGVLALCAFLRYGYAMVRGRCRPNRATWWIWTLVGFMIWGSYGSAGNQPELIWLPASFAIGPLVIGLLLIQFGEGGTTRFDRNCLLGSLASAALWLLTREPLLALFINIFIDFLGGLPTIRKARDAPATEDRTTWFMFLMASVANLAGVREWTLATAAYPLYMFLLTGLIAGLIFRPGETAHAE